MSTTSSKIPPVNNENLRNGAKPLLIQTPSAQTIYPERALTKIEKIGAFKIISGSVTGLVLVSMSIVSLVNPLWMLLPLFFEVVGGIVIAKETSSFKKINSKTLCPFGNTETADKRRQRLDRQKIQKENRQRSLVEPKQCRKNIVKKSLAAGNMIRKSTIEKPLPKIDIDATRSDLVMTARKIQATKMKRARLVSMAKHVHKVFTPLNIPQKSEHVERMNVVDQCILKLATIFQKPLLTLDE